MVANLCIEGVPVAKGRPRFTKSGRTYTSKKTVMAEREIALAYMEKYSEVAVGYVELECTFYMPIPKSETKLNKRLMRDGFMRPTKLPDIDNLIKLVMDGLNGVAFADDKQVVKVIASKHYSDNPRTEVVMWEL